MDGNKLTARAPDEPELADDILYGAKAIAKFWFGSDALKFKNKVYYYAENARTPIFRIKSGLCVRKSALKRWIQELEERGCRSLETPPLVSASSGTLG